MTDDSIPRKPCTGPCGRLLPATTEYFHRKTGNKLQEKCKECRSALRKQPENRAKERAYEQGQYPKHRERILAKNRRYRVRHREQLRKNEAVYRANHREEAKARTKAWYATHLEYARQYRKLYHKGYYQTHRELFYIRRRKRIALLKATLGTYTHAQVLEQLKRQKYRCYYAACGFAKFPRVHEQGKWKYLYHVEHTFPLSRMAGTGIPANDMSYLVLSCEHCNKSKGNKFPWEWPAGGRLL